jgi:membrane protein YqaA with SNARE-associated domain
MRCVTFHVAVKSDVVLVALSTNTNGFWWHLVQTLTVSTGGFTTYIVGSVI